MSNETSGRDIREFYFATLAMNEHRLKREIVEFVKGQGQDRNAERLVEGHIVGRARFFFNSIVPWIESVRRIDNAVVAEFGPGTGSTTVPLALKCGTVHAFDVSPKSTRVLQTRASFFPEIDIQLHVRSHKENLDQLKDIGPVDIVMMFAVLEHMKLEERLEALATAWSVLADGGVIVIADTPNRLSYQHQHTSWLPFFDMLPTRLVREYAGQFPNPAFSDAMSSWIADGLSERHIDEQIDRWGRGVSYHEVEVAIGSLSDTVASDGLTYNLVRAMPIQPVERLLMSFLAKELPDVPLGFCRSSLYLILQKGRSCSGNRVYHEDVVRALI